MYIGRTFYLFYFFLNGQIYAEYKLAWQCSDLAWRCSGGVRGSCCGSKRGGGGKREAGRAARVEVHRVAAARL